MPEDLGVDFVGRYLEQRLVRLDPVADLLEPTADGALSDALAQCRKGYRSRHGGLDSFVGRTLVGWPPPEASARMGSSRMGISLALRGSRRTGAAQLATARVVDHGSGSYVRVEGRAGQREMASPSASVWVGWAWMLAATSLGKASQAVIS